MTAKQTTNGGLKTSRRILVGGAAIFGLGIISYFLLTSGMFLRGMVLPRVGAMLNAKLTAQEITLSPWSELVARQVKLETRGKDPVAEFDELRARYSLWSIIRGKPEISEVTLRGPRIRIEEEADGTSNLTPILKAVEGMKSTKTSETKSSAGVPQILLGTVSLESGQVRISRAIPGGRSVIELEGVRFGMDGLGNGRTSKVRFGSVVTLSETVVGAEGGAPSRMRVGVSGEIGAVLGNDLVPTSVHLGIEGGVEEAGGSYGNLKGARLVVGGDATQKDLQHLTVSILSNQVALATLKVSGPMNLETLDSKLALELRGIDRRVLNLFGGAGGLDFLESTIGATATVELASKLQVITVSGSLRGDRLGVARGGERSPVMDLGLDWEGRLDLGGRTLAVERLSLSGVESGRKVVTAGLAKPMKLGFGGPSPVFQESSFEWRVDELDLGRWQALMGTVGVGGLLSSTLRVEAKLSGGEVGGALRVGYSKGTFDVGGRSVRGVGLELNAALRLERGQDIFLDAVQVEVVQAGSVLGKLQLKLSAALDFLAGQYKGVKNFSVQTSGQIVLAEVSKILGRSDLDLGGGQAVIDATVTASGGSTNLVVRGGVEKLVGRVGKWRFDNQSLTSEIEGELKGSEVSVRRGLVKLATAGGGGVGEGVATFSGAYDWGSAVGKLGLHLAGVDTITLAPFLSGADGKPMLRSGEISAVIAGTSSSGGEILLSGGVEVTNLVMMAGSDAALDTKLSYDLRMKDRILDLRRVRWGYTPTVRGQNWVELTGQLDLRATNSAGSRIHIQGESVDLTPWMDLSDRLSAQGAARGEAGVGEGDASRVRLDENPLGNAGVVSLPDFQGDLKIGNVYAREIHLAGVNGGIRAQRNVVRLEPLEMTCNGARVNAGGTVDLSRSTVAYEVKLKTERVPIEPFANSFSPEYRGQARGELMASVEMKGVGYGGKDLQKSLTGKASLSFTNANIQLVGPKAKIIFTPIAAVLRMPELLRSPLNGFDVVLEAGGGNVEVRNVELRTEAFQARTGGRVPLNEDLSRSPLDLPVTILLRRSIADKANLTPAGASAEAAFVALPIFATIRGTVGAPETKRDDLVIAGLGLKSVVGLPILAGEKAGGIIQGLGNLLSGEKGASKGKTNAPAKTNPLDLLKLLPERKEKKP